MYILLFCTKIEINSLELSNSNCYLVILEQLNLYLYLFLKQTMWSLRPPLLHTFGVPSSIQFDAAYPNPIRFPSVPDDAPALLSLASHQILTAAPLLIPRLFVTAAIPLLIRRPTLLKSLNLQIQRSRGITVVYVRSSCRLVVRAPSPQRGPTLLLSFLCVCVYVRDRFAVYTSWASRLYLGMMIFLPIR